MGRERWRLPQRKGGWGPRLNRKRETDRHNQGQSEGLVFAEKQRPEKNEREEEKEREERKREAEKRKCTEECTEKERERDQGSQRCKPREARSPSGPRPPSGLAARRLRRGAGTGRWRSPGRRAECLRDVFIP